MLMLKNVKISTFGEIEQPFKHAQFQTRTKTHPNQISPLIQVDTTIKAGEILTLMGPSGCGKSTLLNYLTGFLPDYFSAEGEIYLNDREIHHLPGHQRRLGILYQDSLLFEHLTVAENIAFGLVLEDEKIPNRKLTRKDRYQAKREYISAQLAKVGLADKIDCYPSMLSGGQKVRVALLRTLAAKPKALLLDEPFSKLDEALRDTVREWLFDFVKRYQLPTLLVTHDIVDAQAANGNIITLPNIS